MAFLVFLEWLEELRRLQAIVVSVMFLRNLMTALSGGLIRLESKKPPSSKENVPWMGDQLGRTCAYSQHWRLRTGPGCPHSPTLLIRANGDEDNTSALSPTEDMEDSNFPLAVGSR